MLPQQKEVDRSSCRRKTFSVCFRLKAEHCSKLKFFIQRAQTCCSETSRGVGIVVFSPARTKKKILTSAATWLHSKTISLHTADPQTLFLHAFYWQTQQMHTSAHNAHLLPSLCTHVGGRRRRAEEQKEKREKRSPHPFPLAGGK